MQEQSIRPSDQAIDSAVGDETVLLELASGTYYGFDSVGTRIWTLLKEGRTPSEICAGLTEDFDVSAEQVEADVARFLDELVERGIAVPE